MRKVVVQLLEGEAAIIEEAKQTFLCVDEGVKLKKSVTVTSSIYTTSLSSLIRFKNMSATMQYYGFHY